MLNFPHILWINLKRDQHRKHYMETQFAKFNVLNHTRIEGIPGTEFSRWCEVFPPKNQVKIKELGCFLSHLKALKYYVQHPELGSDLIIAEDDWSLEYCNHWKKSFREYLDPISSNADIVKLSITYKFEDRQIFKQLTNTKTNTSTSLAITRSLKQHNISLEPRKYIKDNEFGATAYLVKYQTARKILAQIPQSHGKYQLKRFKYRLISDHFLFEEGVVFSLPLTSYNTTFDSTIHPSHVTNSHAPSKAITDFLWKHQDQDQDLHQHQLKPPKQNTFEIGANLNQPSQPRDLNLNKPQLNSLPFPLQEREKCFAFYINFDKCNDCFNHVQKLLTPYFKLTMFDLEFDENQNDRHRHRHHHQKVYKFLAHCQIIGMAKQNHWEYVAVCERRLKFISSEIQNQFQSLIKPLLETEYSDNDSWDIFYSCPKTIKTMSGKIILDSSHELIKYHGSNHHHFQIYRHSSYGPLLNLAGELYTMIKTNDPKLKYFNLDRAITQINLITVIEYNV